MRITLVAAHERAHRFRWHQLDLMAQPRELPCPVLRTAASFHANQTRPPGRKVRQKLLALELQTHDLSSLLVNPVQLKNSLRRIHTNDCFASIHLGPSGLPVKISFFHFGHFDAVGP